MSSAPKKILIVDFENWDTVMEVPYLFKRAGCVVHVFSRAGSWLLKSRYPKQYIQAPANEYLFREALTQLVEVNEYDWVVPADDTVLIMIAQLQKNSMMFAQKSPIVHSQFLPLIGSKAELSLACYGHGIPTPAFSIYTSANGWTHDVHADLFPGLLKIDKSSGGAGVFYCENSEGLSLAMQNLQKDQKENAVFQKYISGENVAVESIYDSGKLVCYAISVVTKTLHNEFGISSERKYCERPEIEPLLEKIGTTFGIHGFCSMTIMHDGLAYYLVEADCRPQAWYALARLTGTDFSKGIQAFLKHTPGILRPKLPQGKKDVYIRHYSRDHIWAAQNNKKGNFFKWLLNSDGRLYAVPWHDPYLVVCMGYRAFRRIVRGLVAR